jgi:2,3-bisphosphoglycerate-independent phosphoglycerate mutase
MVTYEDSDVPFEEKKILSHSAGSIEKDDTYNLVTDLFASKEFGEAAKQAGMKVYPSDNFRHFVVQDKAETEGIKLIPPHDHLGEKIGPILPSGNANAEVLKNLMYLAHKYLDKHPINERRRKEGKMPANGVWFWAEGTACELPNFPQTYGHKGGVVSAVPLCHGIALLAGLNKVTVEGATGELETNLEGKVDAAFDVLKNDDFVCIHVEAPDECTHNGDLKGKIQAIEWLDSRVIKPMLTKVEQAGWDYRLLVLSDHKTLTSTRGHDGDPVPFFIYDSRKNVDNGRTYCEEDGLKGPYVDAGAKLMGMLFAE